MPSHQLPSYTPHLLPTSTASATTTICHLQHVFRNVWHFVQPSAWTLTLHGQECCQTQPKGIMFIKNHTAAGTSMPILAGIRMQPCMVYMHSTCKQINKPNGIP